MVEDAFLRTYGRSVEFMTFYRHACLIKKAYAPVSRMYVGERISEEVQADSSNLPLTLHGHVSDVGDVIGSSGYINFGPDKNSLQGISIRTKKNLVEYRVRFDDKSWSDWIEEGAYAGTRGQAKMITGFTVRLVPSAKREYTVRSYGRFVGRTDIVRCTDEQDCISQLGTALVGMEVQLSRKP